jgi:hypothetical protein
MKIFNLIYEEMLKQTEELKRQSVYLGIIANTSQSASASSSEMQNQIAPMMKNLMDNPILQAVLKKQSEGVK